MLLNNLLLLSRVFKLHLHGTAIGDGNEPKIEIGENLFHLLRFFPIGLNERVEGLNRAIPYLRSFAEGLDQVLLPTTTGVGCYSDSELRFSRQSPKSRDLHSQAYERGGFQKRPAGYGFAHDANPPESIGYVDCFSLYIST